MSNEKEIVFLYIPLIYPLCEEIPGCYHKRIPILTFIVLAMKYHFFLCYFQVRIELSTTSTLKRHLGSRWGQAWFTFTECSIELLLNTKDWA